MKHLYAKLKALIIEIGIIPPTGWGRVILDFQGGQLVHIKIETDNKEGLPV